MITTTIPAIERQLDFRASPERLWRAITDDAELGAWFGQGAHLVLQPGAEGWFEWEGHGRVPVRTEVVEPITRLSWRWGDVGKSVDDGSTLVEFRLEPLAGGGTRLHLRESGFAAEASRWSNTEGWLSELAELAQHVAAEPFEAVAAVSEFNQRGYELFMQPVVQAMSNEYTAQLTRQLHPLRVQNWAISQLNPWLAWVAPGLLLFAAGSSSESSGSSAVDGTSMAGGSTADTSTASAPSG
jgi:uncharacterized protein YndB with AHSA1/START domain